MPFLSKKQNAWGHSPTGMKALGGPAKVKEWESATNYKDLPEKKKPAGISTHQQLEKDSKSSDPSVRGRGLLGLRFQKGGDLHK